MEESGKDKLRPGSLDWVEGTNRQGKELAYVLFKSSEGSVPQHDSGYLDTLNEKNGIRAGWEQSWGKDDARTLYVMKYNEAGKISTDFTKLDRLRLEAMQDSLNHDGANHDTHGLSNEKTPGLVKRVNEGLVNVLMRNGVEAEVQSLANGLTHVVAKSGNLGVSLEKAIQNVNAKLAPPLLNASALTEPKLPGEPVSQESPRKIVSSLNKAADAFAGVAATHPKAAGAAMGILGAAPVAYETYTVSKQEIERGDLPVEGANSLAKGVTQIAGGAATAGPVATAATPLLGGGAIGAVAYGGVVLGSGYLGSEVAGELYDAGRKLMEDGVNYVRVYFQEQKEARQAYVTAITQNALKNGIPPVDAVAYADAVMNARLAATANAQVENTTGLDR